MRTWVVTLLITGSAISTAADVTVTANKPRPNRWIVPTLAVTAVSLAAAGTVTVLVGSSNLQQFNQQIDDRCATGCAVGDPAVDWSLERRGTKQQLVGGVLIGAGAVTAISAVMYRFWYDVSAGTETPVVVTTSGDGAMAWYRGRF